MVIPGLAVVEHHRSAEASSWVNTGAGDRNGGQVNHEHGEPNWEWC